MEYGSVKSQTEAPEVVNEQGGEDSAKHHTADDDTDEQSADTGRKYPSRERRVPVRFTINSLSDTYDDDRPRSRCALHDSEARQ